MVMNRNLDGVFFRVYREGKYEDICFSDLTEAEQWDVLSEWPTKRLKRMCIILGRTIREIGDQFDIVKGF